MTVFLLNHNKTLLIGIYLETWLWVQLQLFFVVVRESIAMAEKNCEKNYGASCWEYF